MSYRALPIIVILLVSGLTGCREDDYAREFRILEDVTARKDSIDAVFISHLEALKGSLRQSDNDSLSWTYCYQLYMDYSYFNIDSSRYYSVKSRNFATNPRQELFSELSLARMDRIFHFYDEAALRIVSLDDSILEEYPDEAFDYSNTLVPLLSLLRRTASPGLDQRCGELCDFHMQKALLLDSTSTRSRFLMVSYYRHQNPEKASWIAREAYYTDNDFHRKAYFADVVGDWYHLNHDRKSEKLWFTRAAICDLQVPVRDGGSTYKLANVLFEDGDYSNALKYSNISLDNALSCNFRSRLIRVASYQKQITSAIIRNNTQMVHLSEVLIVILTVLLFAVLLLLQHSRKQSRKLHEASAIKNEYIAQYMAMATDYMDMVDKTKISIRKAAQQENPEILRSLLHGPLFADSESANFLHNFDETALVLFPGFVEKINTLFPPDKGFSLGPDGQLPNELRILASMILGLNKSGNIARFLHLAPATIYSYRSRMAAASICGKDHFEDAVLALFSEPDNKIQVREQC